MQAIEFEYLLNRKDAIPTLRSWFESEWEPYYGPNGPGDALADLNESCNDTALPIAIVAYCGATLVGTAALKEQSVSTHSHLSPWVAALLVNPQFRRQGVAEALIRRVEQLAKKLDFKHLYIGTGKGSGTPGSAIRNLGWRYLDSEQYFVSEVHVFTKALSRRLGPGWGPRLGPAGWGQVCQSTIGIKNLSGRSDTWVHLPHESSNRPKHRGFRCVFVNP